MNFNTEIQNDLVLDTNRDSRSPNLETTDYGLNPIADEFSNDSQLDSITGESISLEPVEILPEKSDTHQLVFIGSDVKDRQTLVDNISGATDVVLLDSDSDELIQISEHLSNYQDLDAVHIVSHGEPGQLSFSNSQLNQDTLPEYVHLVEDWGNSLSAEADLLFYGCDVSSGEQGNAFIQQVSQITDADVAASVDDTGIDGNWSLETSVGNIETTSVFNEEINDAYQHNLDEFGFTSGSLPDFSSVDLSSTNFDFTSVPADSLTVFADAGLDFGGVDASTLDNIDFNEIPAEDLSILQDAGLELEPLSSSEIAEINLDVLSGLDYLPEDIELSEFDNFDSDTKFAQFSDLVATNAELFDYKNPDLEVDENLTIEQLSRFNADDFRALDYAESNPGVLEVFDSEFFLEEYPNVEEAGVNPFANYYEFGQNGGRYPNEVFKTFGESEEVLVVSADLTSSEFAEFQTLASANAYGDGGLSEAILWFIGGLIIFVDSGIKAIEDSQNSGELFEQTIDDGYVSELPIEDNLGDSNNTGGIPDEVMIGTEPFDLGELTQIDPESIPNGNEFLEDILNGQFEFPDTEEGGSYVLPIETNPILSDLINSSTFLKRTSKGLREYENTSGGFEKANEIFDDLDLSNVKDLENSKFEGRRGTLDDGRRVIVRNGSKGAVGEEGFPTIEIQKVTGKKVKSTNKIRFKG